VRWPASLNVVVPVAVSAWAGLSHAQPALNAQPSGGAVVAGSATIAQSATKTTIQQATQRAAINWQSFNIGSQQTVQFQQPATSSVALNRVVGPNPSQIAGRIDANGQVIITNQSGVTFYRGAQVNTAGLMVTAAGISNSNFMAGRMVFDQAPKPGAAVVNQGRITVRDAGLAALVAPQVANSGVINARLGHVVLAGAQTATLDLYGDGLMAIDVTGQVARAQGGGAALVTNTGVIRADGGTVQLTARAVDGVVETLVDAGGRIQANSVGSRTGTVVLNGVGGNITVAGQLLATGNAPGTSGGNVVVNPSGSVAIASSARIDASGRAGGGTVAIGTTLARARGGPGTTSRHTAANVTVAPGATIAANATVRGNGGHVTVLASQATVMDGAISATGGPLGGNGGLVETSGMQVLDLGPTASVTAAAPHGVAGQWLLDPDSNVTITNTATSDVICTAGICQPTIDNSILAPSVIEASLNSGTSVTVTTSNPNGTEVGNIIVGQTAGGTDGEIQLTGTATVGLTLNAGAGGGAGSITINSPITDSLSDGGALSVTLSAPRGAININNAITVNGGVTASATLTVLGANVTSGGAQIYNSPVTLAAPVTLDGAAGITFNNAISGGANALTLTTAGGPVTLSGITTTGGLTFNTTNPLGGLPGTVTLDTGTYNVTPELYVFPAVTTNGTLTLGAQTGFGAVTLGSNTTFVSGVAGAGPDFESTVDGDFSLTLNLTSAAALFVGTVGATTPLASLTVNGNSVIDANITTGGPQTYNGTVQLNDPVTLDATANGTTNGAIDFTAQILGQGNSLTLTSGSGNQTLSGFNGGGGTLTLTPTTGTVTLDAGNYTMGTGESFFYSFPAVTTNGTLTLGQPTSFGAVTLGSATTIDSSAVNGAIDFTTIDGAFGLVVTAGAGDVNFGVVGGTTPLASLSVSGPTFLNGNVTTAGAQTYNGAVTLDNTVTLNSTANGANGAIDFASTVDAFGDADVLPSLTVNAGTGAVTFGNAVGGEVAPANLTVTGGSITLDGNVAVNADTIPGGFIVLDSTGAGSTLAINTTLSAAQIALMSAGPITEGANGVLDQTMLAVVSAGPVSLTGANNVTDLAADITGAGNGFAFRDDSTNLAIDTVAIQATAPISVTGITTNNGQIQVGTTTFGNITVEAPVSSGGGAIALAAAPGSAITNTSAITSSGGNIAIIADQLNLAGGTVSTGSTTAGTVVLGPATQNLDVVLGEASGEGTLGLQAGDLASITAGMVQVGYRAENGTASYTGAITIGGEAGIALSTANFSTLLLVTGGAGTITQAAPISFPGGTFGVIADGGIALGSGNSVGTFAGFTDGGLVSFDNGAALTIGSLALPTLGVAVNADSIATTAAIPSGTGLSSNPLSGVTASGPLTIGATGGLTLADNVTAPGQTITLGVNGGGITQTAGIITAGTLTGGATGSIALNDSNAISTVSGLVAQNGLSLADGIDLTVSNAVSGQTSTTIRTTGTLTVTGSVLDTGAGTISLTGGSIAITNTGLVDDSGTGTTTLTATNGTITDSGSLIAGTLQGSATGAATLTGATPFNNQVATLGSFSASNLTLLDGTALTISGPVTAEFLNITATGRMVLAGNIATTGAPLAQQSGATPAAQGSTLQVVASSASPGTATQFVQIGTVTLTDPPATTLRVQLPATGGTASFNNLIGTGANLVLALGTGTATGTMQVGGLLVIGQSGSATLTGSVAGVTTKAAAALGQITPAIDPNYTFNGCTIGLAACAPPPTPTPTPIPPVPVFTTSAPVTAVLGGLWYFLQGPRVLAAPPPVPANLILVPTPPLLGNQLAPQDVVPPNISFEDY